MDKLFDTLVYEKVITDEQIILYYYTHCYNWGSPNFKCLAKHTENNLLSILASSPFADSDYIKEFVVKHMKEIKTRNENLIKKIFKKLSAEIAQQDKISLSTNGSLYLSNNTVQLDEIHTNAEIADIDKSTNQITENDILDNKYPGYSTFVNDTLVKFDERDIVDGNYSIPKGVTIIGNNAFSRCYQLKKVVIPASVKHIGQFAFAICKNLEEVVIPASVKNIEAGCFFACVKLTKLKLPKNVTNIETLLCFYCKSLTQVELSPNVSNIACDSFLMCDKIEEINLPKHFQDDWNNNKFKTTNRGTKHIIDYVLKN